MKRLIAAFACLAFLAAVEAAPALPRAETPPADSDELRDAYAKPGASCFRKAIEQHRLVLSDPDNRADHHALAESYEFFADEGLEC